MSKPAEGLPWFKYRNIFLQDKRINEGVKFWKDNKEILDNAEKNYGVSPEIITAIIGVETYYGTRMGNRSVLRSLATLTAAYPRREEFFGKEPRVFFPCPLERNHQPNSFSTRRDTTQTTSLESKVRQACRFENPSFFIKPEGIASKI